MISEDATRPEEFLLVACSGALLTIVAVLLQSQRRYLQNAVAVVGVREGQVLDVCFCVQHVYLQICTNTHTRISMHRQEFWTQLTVDIGGQMKTSPTDIRRPVAETALVQVVS